MDADRRTSYSQWTVDTLREHLCETFKLYQRGVDERFRASEEATRAALASSTKAVDKTERLADIRADVQERLAGERANTLATMMTRAEYETQHKVLVDKINGLQAHVDRTGGSNAGISSAVGWLLAGIGGVVAVVTILLEVTATR